MLRDYNWNKVQLQFGLIDLDNIVKIYASFISDGFYSTLKNGEIGKIYKDGIGVSCKDGEVIITEIQFAGKKRMKVVDYLNGSDGTKLIGKVFE